MNSGKAWTNVVVNGNVEFFRVCTPRNFLPTILTFRGPCPSSASAAAFRKRMTLRFCRNARGGPYQTISQSQPTMPPLPTLHNLCGLLLRANQISGNNNHLQGRQLAVLEHL